MGTLKQDIKVYSSSIVKAFDEDHIYLDYSIGSLIEIDRFFNKHTVNGRAIKRGRLSRNLGSVLFSIGCYVGDCLIENVKGAKWVTNDKDPQGEINAEIIYQALEEVVPQPKKTMSDFLGILSDKSAKKLHRHIKKVRNEWDRDI